MEPSDSAAEQMRTRAADLEHFCSCITSCHVTLHAPHQHHRQGNLFSVHIDLVVPGRTIVVGRDGSADHSHEDPHIAIRDAFDAAARQLHSYLGRRRAGGTEHGREA
jgi:ribosome-associated translation inhibitor RaiA